MYISVAIKRRRIHSYVSQSKRSKRHQPPLFIPSDQIWGSLRVGLQKSFLFVVNDLTCQFRGKSLVQVSKYSKFTKSGIKPWSYFCLKLYRLTQWKQTHSPHLDARKMFLYAKIISFFPPWLRLSLSLFSRGEKETDCREKRLFSSSLTQTSIQTAEVVFSLFLSGHFGRKDWGKTVKNARKKEKEEGK